jgi:hypothetical protein
MKVSDILVRALKEVDDANIPDELRAVAFEKAVDLVRVDAGVPIGQPQQPPGNGAAAPAGEAEPAADTTPLGRIARRLKLDIEVVKDVFDHGEQGFQVIVSPRKLEKQRQAATRQLALLVAAGRQAAGDDEDWTALDKIRTVCADYNKLDSSNFAAHIKTMGDEFTVKGSGQKREVKVTRPGWDAARELVEKLAGAEG